MGAIHDKWELSSVSGTIPEDHMTESTRSEGEQVLRDYADLWNGDFA